MATNIPPHNLGEVIDACIALMDNPDITIDELIEHVPAPDFPTGGIMLGRQGARSAYHTGKGSVVVRGRVDIEEVRKDRRGDHRHRNSLSGEQGVDGREDRGPRARDARARASAICATSPTATACASSSSCAATPCRTSF